VDSARNNLVKRFKLTEVQAQAILDMQLRRLAGLERRKIQDEFKEKTKLISHLERLLSRPELMRKVVRDELLEVREKYADSRRTQIVQGEESEMIAASDLLPDEKVWVMIGEKGTIARTTTPEMVQIPRKPAEQPVALLEANTLDILYLFAANGDAVSMPVYQLPQSREMGIGTHWADLTPFSRRNHLAAALVKPKTAVEGYLFLTTVGGVVKRVKLSDLPGISSETFSVMNVADEDSLGWASLTHGEDEILLATASGQLIRFKETDVRPMGLPAGGVMGIKLADDADGIVTMDIFRPDTYVWSITDNGLAKATKVDQYPTQGRYGQGVINVRLPKDAAEVAATVVGEENTLIIITTAIGTTKKLRLKESYIGSRSIKPRSVLTIGTRNRVIGAVKVTARPELEEGEEAIAQQLSLLDVDQNSKQKIRTKSKKKSKG
jgi:DNA gyrase subunit A